MSKFDELIDLLEKTNPDQLSLVQKRDLLVYCNVHLKSEVSRIYGSKVTEPLTERN